MIEVIVQKKEGSPILTDFMLNHIVSVRDDIDDRQACLLETTVCCDNVLEYVLESRADVKRKIKKAWLKRIKVTNQVNGYTAEEFEKFIGEL